LSVAVPTEFNQLFSNAHFARDLAACTLFSLSWSYIGAAPRKLMCRQIADLPFQAVGRESAEAPQNVALESPRSKKASARAGPPTIAGYECEGVRAHDRPEGSGLPRRGCGLSLRDAAVLYMGTIKTHPRNMAGGAVLWLAVCLHSSQHAELGKKDYIEYRGGSTGRLCLRWRWGSASQPHRGEWWWC